MNSIKYFVALFCLIGFVVAIQAAEAEQGQAKVGDSVQPEPIYRLRRSPDSYGLGYHDPVYSAYHAPVDSVYHAPVYSAYHAPVYSAYHAP